jgi:hypothetical protein
MKSGIPPDALNGLILAVRLIFLWIAIVAFALILPQEWMAWIVIVVGDATVIIGLAVGIALAAAMRNFVAGIYVMFSDPFDVGDLVQIGTHEGMVLEISMNYTKLRQFDGSTAIIPNDQVMNSSVTNYQFDRQYKTQKEVEVESSETESIPSRVWSVISEVMDTSKLIQYSLELRFPVRQKIDHYDQVFSEVCKRWKKRFKIKPVYAMTSMSHLAFTYAFTIFVEDPKILMEYRSQFIEDIGRAVH